MNMTTLPDWLDLNDWIALVHPAVHDATRYLSSMQAQYDCWLKVWQLQGCPAIPDVIDC